MSLLMTADHMTGMLPFLFSDLASTCCKTCKQHGETIVDFNRNGKMKPALQHSIRGVESFLDDDTDFSFPIYGWKWQKVYKKYYRYIPLVESPGFAFIMIMDNLGSPVWHMYYEILGTWPYLLFTVLTALTAGIIIWFLVSDEIEIR